VFICVKWLFAYTAAMKPLSAKRRSELRAEAHKLAPVVIIGDKGLTDEVLAEVDRSLKAHELIKVRAATDEREARDAWLEAICEKLEAHPVQQIGKVFVIYRQNPPEPKARAPRAAPSKGRRPPGGKPKAEVTRTSRPRSRTPSPRPESAPRRRRRETSR
jgi:RNA-binding protein